MRFPRSCGTLVHPTSFPAPYGMGDFGQSARTFIDFLQATNQTIWQVLPLSPVGQGNSPYTSYSAFAGNEYLINPDMLHEKGLISGEELFEARLPLEIKTDYESAYRRKNKLFTFACSRFYSEMDREEESRLESFIEQNSYWLQDYALYMVLLKYNNRTSWNRWETGLSQRDPYRIADIKKEFETEIRREIWMQFEFSNQWTSLKNYANERGIRVIGDIPIFVDHNSADVWANPQFFSVNSQGDRELVAGVPPDYFSETGQLWGNPLYEWDRLKEDGYGWWVQRFKQTFRLYDAIRVDHFRGFEASWQVSAGEKTAENGIWVKGPGKDFFSAIHNELGSLPIIAEDLGVITPEVEELRDEFGFPGMKVLQFAFDKDPENSFLPHNYDTNSVVYSGTHDNDTSVGWYHSTSEEMRHELRVYTRSDCAEPSWELIRLAVLSVADQAVFPLQDFMSLDSSHRMNTPGTAGDNWEWRYTPEMLDLIDRGRIQELIRMSNR